MESLLLRIGFDQVKWRRLQATEQTKLNIGGNFLPTQFAKIYKTQ